TFYGDFARHEGRRFCGFAIPVLVIFAPCFPRIISLLNSLPEFSASNDDIGRGMLTSIYRLRGLCGEGKPEAMSSFGQPTINDVARRAKVSNMTVSRVVTRNGYVSEKTRRKVEAAIAELGYQPNAAAKSMRTKSTQSIG